jgi:hypothetical protein
MFLSYPFLLPTDGPRPLKAGGKALSLFEDRFNRFVGGGQ